MKKRNLPTHFILERRKKLGMTQGQLARKAGLSVSAISLIENYEQGWKPETFSDIARALECDPLAHPGTLARAQPFVESVSYPQPATAPFSCQ